LNVECEQLIWKNAQRGPTSPHSACGFGTTAVAYSVLGVITLLSSACVVLPAMTTAPLKASLNSLQATSTKYGYLRYFTKSQKSQRR